MKTVAPLLVVLLAASACSSKRGDTTAADEYRKKHSVTVTEDAPGSTGGGRTGNGITGKAGSGGSATGGRTATPPPPGATPPYDVPNFLKIEVPEYESWGGETCAPPRRGSVCEVPFHGVAYSTVEGNELVLLAYENGSVVETASRVIRLAKGRTKIVEYLTYKIGPDAQYVTFKVVMRDARGLKLAENSPQSYPITG